jgi:hypothetical protein
VLLREAIAIPEHISASDFVLKLDSGVEHAATTVAEYVVTDKLAEAFDKALASVESVLASGGDRGSFVHGSFGSGKSHFMAILHLLLAGNAQAKALPGLQRAIGEHSRALAGDLLTLDFHLIGAESFESALFSGYLRQVALIRPDAPLPVLHNTDALFADAVRMRGRLGDEAFFAGLNEGSASQWGSYGGSWGPDSFDAALSAALDDGARGRLATALVSTYFTGYERAGQWVGIEDGLKTITAHAKSLGFRAVVLFLDELVLWLASHLADSEFVSTEGSKVAKLVETGAGGRAVPIVSFVARQRDLKDFLGDSVPGAERVAVGQTFTWWEDRFDTITLEASDLPEIAHKRLLTPASPAGAQALSAALTAVKANTKAWDDLLRDEHGADEAAFAKVYPFSPALVDTLVTLSGLLQRERTALKVMAQLLVRGRDVLQVTDVIPVGDLYDVMVEGGDTPLTAEMQRHFAIARELYRVKLRPMLLANNGLTEADVTGSRPGALAPGAPATVTAFFTDDRLAKTLLIAALAPGAPALRDLTASKLAYLNYGTVPAIVPGTEAVAVITRVKGWAERVGEIQVGDGTDPLISVVISGVDYDSVLSQVRAEDSPGARRRLLRRMVFEQIGMPDTDTLLAENPHPVTWRGSKRVVDIVFGNVRDAQALPDDVLRASGSNWKLVIDYPFDDPGHGPNDDLVRMENLRAAGVTSRTVAWIPAFLSASRQDDLGTLALLEYLLAGDAFTQYSAHLPSDQRQLARRALDNRRTSLRESLAAVIRQAYGIARSEARDIDTSYGDVTPFVTLDPGLTVQAPVGATLGAALAGLADQMLSAQFPDHPRFEPGDSEVKRGELNTVAEHVARAMASEGRVDPVDPAKRGSLRRVANALGVGQMLENHYIFSQTTFPWRNRLIGWAAADGLAEIPITAARGWLAPYGMTRDVENLVLIAWALLDDKQWTKSGATVTVTAVEQVTDDLVLREPTLPEQPAWEVAVPRAAALFGVTVAHLRSAANLATLAGGVRARAQALQASASDLVAQLEVHRDVLALEEGSPRLATARLGRDLLGQLARETDDVVLVQALTDLPLPREPQSLAKSMASSGSVATALRAQMWPLLLSLRDIGEADPRRAEATSVLATLAEAAAAEELHQPLEPALQAAVGAASRTLSSSGGGAAGPRDGGQSSGSGATSAGTDAGGGAGSEAAVAGHVNDITLEGIDDAFGTAMQQARAALRDHPGRSLHVRWWLE